MILRHDSPPFFYIWINKVLSNWIPMATKVATGRLMFLDSTVYVPNNLTHVAACQQVVFLRRRCLFCQMWMLSLLLGQHPWFAYSLMHYWWISWQKNLKILHNPPLNTQWPEMSGDNGTLLEFRMNYFLCLPRETRQNKMFYPSSEALLSPGVQQKEGIFVLCICFILKFENRAMGSRKFAL